MEVSDFIKSCSRGIYDPSLMVIRPEEWLELLNFQSGELFPEIGYRGKLTVDVPTTDRVDLSGTTYKNLYTVKEVYLQDSDGKNFLYDNWIYDRELEELNLNPVTSKVSDMSPGDYKKVVIIWQGYLPTFTKITEEIDLPNPKLVLLEKVCIKEALRRILFDHAKLDRYRVLVSRMNEYALMAIIRDLSTEIEISKRRLVDTHEIRSY